METMVTHEKSRMAMMEYPTKGLSEHVGWIDNARDVMELNVTKCPPMLYSEVPELNMA